MLFVFTFSVWYSWLQRLSRNLFSARVRGMAGKDQLKLLKKSVIAWNEWRNENKSTDIDLRRADLAGRQLDGANLKGANLHRANLRCANLREADLTDANLWSADLTEAKLDGAKIRNACLDDAVLVRASVAGADFTGSHFRETKWTDLSGALGVEPLVGPDGGRSPEFEQGERPSGELAFRVRAPMHFAPLIRHPKTPAAPDGLCLFVSYTGLDQETAEALISAFEAAGHVCWDYLSDPLQDEDDDTFTAELAGRVLGSDALVVLVSKHSESRAWVGHEIEIAQTSLKRYVDVAMEPGELYSAKLESKGTLHFVMMNQHDIADTARRAVDVLRDPKRWGSGQTLGPSTGYPGFQSIPDDTDDKNT